MLEADPETIAEQAGGKSTSYAPGADKTKLQDFLAIETWTERPIPKPDRLLGDLVTTTTRMFLVGSTGLGKTLMAFGMACGMASGRGFLHWRSERAAKVLYIDGEMPAELIKARSIDALRRLAGSKTDGKLFIYARDSTEEFAKMFPALPPFAPLTTKEGHTFIFELIDALGGVDVVVFDNVMSLVPGDQKDEVPWSETTPLVAGLTSQRIGQVWCDHTGHDRDKQYGTSTKAWRFDAVGLMKALPDDQKEKRETAFTLSFESPGKARRRTPDNWQDFEVHEIRLAGDVWTSQPADSAGMVKVVKKLTPTVKPFYSALMDALAITEVLGRTTRNAWYAECVRVGLAEALAPDDTYKAKDRKQARFRKCMFSIKEAGLIGVDGDEILHLA